MKKLMKKIKMNNKGFTLVELIVVIAIIAIITVVVAPQYLGYVEKSREAMDDNAAGEYAHAAEIAMVEASAAGATIPASFTVSASGDVSLTASAEDATTPTFDDFYLAICPDGQYEFVSDKYAGGLTITLNANGTATPAPTSN